MKPVIPDYDWSIFGVRVSNSLSNLNAGLIKAGGGLDLSALGNINSIG